MKRTTPIFYVAVFVAGFLTASLWQSFKAAYYWRPVQYLEDSTGANKAVLERIDGIDLNFRVKLNGKRIYWSPDFRPSSSLSFRETLVWDGTGRVLILEVLGRRLFGYDVSGNRQLSNNELLSAKLSQPSIGEYGFEGQWPTKGD